ncbi:MAG: ABC transporter substrate-binding protein [Actinomycetota bacterium]|nr:ABC transporter substrate-binding protein [Actinomycetota bacterium]
MRASRKVLVVLLLFAVALAVTPAASAKKRTILTVGVTQDVDNMNPIIGVTVSAYEAWNLQYATLTDKAAKDFHTIPGLAKSWKGSADKKTWTYTLRDGLEWSDGKPLTAEDIVFTVNTSRGEEWNNYTATTGNLTASAPDPKTVVIKTSVPDPKLPTMDVYILPKHIWGPLGKDKRSKYAAQDGVGSGPFVLEKFEPGQFWRMKANPTYWSGKPALSKVVFRHFNNGDAMVAALKTGELDAVQDVTNNSFKRLKKDKKLTLIEGQQGTFGELAINGGDGLKKPHPALLDSRVRQAIGFAIDKKTIVEKVDSGLGVPADTISPSADPTWMPKIPDSEKFTFDLQKANSILDQAGYKDTNGDGIREMPGGGKALNFRYAVRSESPLSAPTAEFITGWLRKIGIATTQKVYNESQLTEEIGKGTYDLFVWGWTPFVDPEPMLSYFTCDQLSKDPKDPTNYYNDASRCDKTYDRLYAQQKVELDRSKRMEIVHEMLTRFYKSGVYFALDLTPDLQAYRNDRFTGWVRQPAKVGPVFFSNTSPSYALLKPVASSTGGGGLGTAGVLGIVVAGALVLAGLGFWLVRRRSVAERE